VTETRTERLSQIVSAARALLEDGGPDAVTMRAIAERLGIRAPSLYKHIPDKADLETAIIADALTEMAEAYAASIAGSPDPLGAVALTYRTWALRHPHLYRLMTANPLDRDRLPEGLEDRAAAPIVEACGGDPDRARAAWAFAHGMVSLELAGRFPPDADLDGAWNAGIGALRPVAAGADLRR
jgi:AcrR family transcriptional regulator